MRRLMVLLAAVCLVPVARPDATVLTRAMTASTIAEIHVEANEVRVEIEIGVSDLGAFRNLLPDEIRERMALEAVALTERLPRFFGEDWTVRADGGTPLPGLVTTMDVRPRLVRDEITGEPVPNQPSGAEMVVHAEFTFALETPPEQLTLKPPSGSAPGDMASIGFVLYHAGLPVNDFRYLAAEETVDLRWEDPWYSKFRNKNLQRQYNAPLSTYLYVEPYEVRKEIVVRPRDLQAWVDLGLEGKQVIAAEDWGTLKQSVVEFLLPRCPVLIDGRAIEPVLDRVHFIQRTLRTSRVLEEPQDLNVVSATLGVIIAYPIDGLPENATMEWDLFPEGVTSIPSSAVDEAGGLPSFLTREDNVLHWQNFLLHPTRAKLVELEPPPPPARLHVPLASVVFALGGLLTLVSLRNRSTGRVAGAAMLVAAFALWPFARVDVASPFAESVAPAEDDAASVCGDLLRNVYRAFDFRAESDIYDVLARSTEGDLLTDVYLQTRKSLELENQGGARARVQSVEVVSTETAAIDEGPGFQTLCTWNVTGSVGHWGHLHQRRNQYEAELTIEPVEGAWKITGLQLRSEERL